MKLKKIAAAVMWLPGFEPENNFPTTPMVLQGEGPVVPQREAEIIQFPKTLAAEVATIKTVWPRLPAGSFSPFFLHLT